MPKGGTHIYAKGWHLYIAAGARGQSLWSTPPPAQCTMDASKMMARITTTTQKKNTTMPGMAYPATVLALATAPSYPPPPTYSAGG